MPSKKTRDLKKVSREKGITYKARFPSEKKSLLICLQKHYNCVIELKGSLNNHGNHGNAA